MTTFTIIALIYILSIPISHRCSAIELEQLRKNNESPDHIFDMDKVINILSFIPVYNTWMIFQHIRGNILQRRKINAALKKLDPMAKRLGYKSMKHMLKSEGKKMKTAENE